MFSLENQNLFEIFSAPGFNVLISRTDKIGDVVLTLPLAQFLKENFPHCTVSFLGQSYTRDVVESCQAVDFFYDWQEIQRLLPSDRLEFGRSKRFGAILHVFPSQKVARWARDCKIGLRIGAIQRLYHIFTCNVFVSLSRRHSPLHEAELNFKILNDVVPSGGVPFADIFRYYKMHANAQLPHWADRMISIERFNLILHPRSMGSAREWPLEHYARLIQLLAPERFKIFISGGPAESEELKSYFDEKVYLGHGFDIEVIAGNLSLSEFQSFIQRCDGLIAASTGPLHLAAALGKCALGIYPPIKPMHGGRWGPIGENASYLSAKSDCEACRKNNDCSCMRQISPEQVAALVQRWKKS